MTSKHFNISRRLTEYLELYANKENIGKNISDKKYCEPKFDLDKPKKTYLKEKSYKLENNIKREKKKTNLFIQNQRHEKKGYNRKNRRQSYRTRESILSADKRLSKDPGHLSHHLRPIFKYLISREVNTSKCIINIKKKQIISQNQSTVPNSLM